MPNFVMPSHWAQTRRHARRVECVVRYAGPAVAVSDLRRQLPDLSDAEFARAVRLTLDERRLYGWADLDGGPDESVAYGTVLVNRLALPAA